MPVKTVRIKRLVPTALALSLIVSLPLFSAHAEERVMTTQSAGERAATTACLQRGTSLAGSAHLARVRCNDLTDAQWRRLEPLLPPERPRTGRPNHNHRTILNGILWVLRTGAPWRDLPERYGPVGTVSSRFYRWRAAGIWDRVLAALQSQAEERNEVDWSLHFVDATVIRAHQHAAGARRASAVGG